MAELQPVGIEGACLVRLTAHPDPRGSFTEAYRRDFIPGMREMVQANLSLSRARVMRGLHLHRKQADYWMVVTGRILVGLYDPRRGSPTEGRKAQVPLAGDDEPRTPLYIPRGVAHGFYAETEVILQYLVDEYFDGGDEYGVAWDDPDVGIAWPLGDGEPIVSERDQANPSLAEVLRDPPRYEP
jgi:dTDP-4-dehydrorhamnose 3,5-epimerase